MFLNCRTVSGVMCYSGKSRLIYKQYNVDCNKASCIFLVLARPRQIVSQETTVRTYYVPFNLEFSNLSGGMLKIPKYSFVCCLWLKYVLTPTVAVFTS